MSPQTRNNLILFCILGVLFFSPLGNFIREKVASWSTPISKFMLSAPNLSQMDFEYRNRKGAYVLNWNVKDVHNQTIDLNSLKGHVIFLTFWDYSNTSSKAILPYIQNLYSNYKHNDQIVFLTISQNSNLKASLEFIQNEHYTFPIYTTKKTDPNLKTDSTPTTILINKKGELVYMSTGAKKWDDQKVKIALNILINQE
ncbi:hypothetical protein UJ101_00233 [Flavobacteriaceae bacterium UJ101]|nr:hypothetical protein UJ101_00233 [Flavobacteriaceae bacterium UJ101]